MPEALLDQPLLPVAEALARILAGAGRLGEEQVPLSAAAGRTLAAPLAARRTQPPFDCSSLDGYAVRAAEVADGRSFRVVGASAAGTRFPGTVGPGEVARIFTGAPLPAGTDAVIAQEDSVRDGDSVRFTETAKPGKFVRRAGLDFSAGEVLLPAGRRIGPLEIALAAAMGFADMPVARKPRVALLATGDELVPPGIEPGPDQIPASNLPAIAAMVAADGAAAIDLGIARDTPAALLDALARAEGADVLVTLGGASVGEHDLVRETFSRAGMRLDFWRIAMRPGRPMMHGAVAGIRFLGLPGNPVSAIVCAHLFLRPLIGALQGRPETGDVRETVVLADDLPANDQRQDYLRARRVRTADGVVVTPMTRQDSSMLRALAEADCLIIRPPHAPPAKAGERVEIVPLG
jgi:molybdopterin molybdotransferase